MNILIGVMISMLIMSSNVNDSNDPNDVVNEVLFEEIEAIISHESDLTYSIYDNQFRFDLWYERLWMPAVTADDSPTPSLNGCQHPPQYKCPRCSHPAREGWAT